VDKLARDEGKMSGIPNGKPVGVVGRVEVIMTEDGKVHVQAQVPNRELGRMMMNMASAQMELNLFAQEQAKKVQVVPSLEGISQ
jgi:hypothetical protein